MNREFQPDEERFIARAKQALDHSVDRIDHPILLRLQHARVAAGEARPARSWRLLLAGGLATVSVAALALVLWVKQPALENHHAPVLEDMDLVLSVENVELAEDLEFYHWLADDDVTG
ncbi:MAG: hypothetical protein ABIR36_04465 [Nitrospiraceae bacterium]